MGSNFKVGIIAMWIVVPGLKFDEKSIGDGLKSSKRLLCPSRPLVLRMICVGSMAWGQGSANLKKIARASRKFDYT